PYVSQQITMSCCRCTAPFGKPVEPDEYCQYAGSSRDVTAASSVAEAFAIRSSYDVYGPGKPPATSTCLRYFASASAGPASARSGAETTATLARLSFRK